MNRKSSKKIQGFTLLEVLVALAILAIALAAAMKASIENAENARYLRDKTLAHWVAMNVLTDIQIHETWPSASKEGSTMMAKREWYWKVEVSETADKELRRLEVKVRYNPEATEPIAILIGFIARPK